MAKVMTDDKHYKDIAETIRAYDDFYALGEDEEGNKPKLKPEEMANALSAVIQKNNGEWEGFGYFSGYYDGQSAAEEEMNEYKAEVEVEKAEMRKQAYDDFWDLLQTNGKRVNYNSGFSGLKFNRDNFKPKYDFKPTNAQDIFNNCPPTASAEMSAKELDAFIKNKKVSMKQVEEEQGIKFDFSNCTNLVRAFAGCLFSELNEIDLRGITNKNNTALAFYGGYTGYARIYRIEKIIVNETTQIAADAFHYQDELMHIRFEGVIGTDLIFRDSPLDKDSIEHIINNLSDTATGKSVAFNRSAISWAYDTTGEYDFYEEEIPEWLDIINTKPNWNIYIY